MSSKPPVSVDIDSERSWDLAKRYANQINPVPFQISMAIKAMRKIHDDSAGAEVKTVPQEAVTAIKLIDKTPNLKTPLYFAASILFPDRFKHAEDDASRALLQVLQPGFFGSLLALIYMYRRIGKLAPPDAFEMLSKDLLTNMEMGFILGREIQEVGAADGILIGGIRHMAVGSFLLRDAEAYTKYRNVKKHKLEVEHERPKWGCDHAQVAAYLLQNVGFQWDLRKMRLALLGEVDHKDLDAQHQRFARIVYWLDSLKDGSKSADKLGNFKVTEAGFKKLLEDSGKVFNNGSSFVWMKRGGQVPDRKSAAPATPKSDAPTVEIPGFTKEELATLTQEELKQVIARQKELENASESE